MPNAAKCRFNLNTTKTNQNQNEDQIMPRVTINDLKNEAIYQNEVLVDSGSNVLFKIKERNGYRAVDLHFIDENGEDVCHDCIEGGSSRECINRLYIEARNNIGKCYHGSSITRKTAKARLLGHIDFDKDPSRLSNFELNLLTKWAKLTKFKKPYKWSRGYGFFLHLKNRVEL